ncbi:hypothetical protein [Martelella mediterranea]|uniref:Uncharacterized protein n=1 Tax=Martelella mediterranea TaxID=293089 RepID=A0A4R3P0V2_9HYPH|nr:hypothetical protein [Martelella mediterranea]TCT42751.1 hypothetical protein EDC90_100452 [Martelella mediterranea]
MTAPAIVRTAEWKRMAKIARDEGVDCWIERDGNRYGVSPKKPEQNGAIDSNHELRL